MLLLSLVGKRGREGHAYLQEQPPSSLWCGDPIAKLYQFARGFTPTPPSELLIFRVQYFPDCSTSANESMVLPGPKLRVWDLPSSLVCLQSSHLSIMGHMGTYITIITLNILETENL